MKQIKWKNKFLFITLLILSLHCSVFYSSERNLVDTNFPIQNKSLSYELIGWDDELDRRRVTFLLSALQNSKKFKSVQHYAQIKSDLHVQIILESSPKFKFFMGESSEPVSYMAERAPGRFSIYLINRFLAVSTFFVIPDIDYDDDHIVFRTMKSGKMISELRYPIESYRIFGWVSVMLMWADDSDEWKTILTEKVNEYLGDIKHEI
ncbi:hypothetical protein [Leptospira kemamanensis]|uniref:hypothetical protein n=1 Tax=Leptospira kemamanensis TaxID=2484942 RepID=UPI001ABF72CF|nr:hypothetical protein [Leptospira kemamanensis]